MVGAAVTLLVPLTIGAYGVYSVDEEFIDRPADCVSDVRFAVIGDFGSAGQPEKDVANLIDSWSIDFVVTLGDNNYPDGEAATIDANIGQYYHDYIYPYQGEYGAGGGENRFLPTLGNHDWRTESLQPHYDYFTLPGNERYYEVGWGAVDLFVVDSDPHEPDGVTADSIQGRWLRAALQNSDAPWKVVAMHHAPFSSSAKHGSNPEMQWPFAAWGATAVLAGHDHTYERLHVDDILYFVNGLGGRSIYRIGKPAPNSVVRYNQNYGAMLVNANEECINFSFISREGRLIDSVTLN